MKRQFIGMIRQISLMETIYPSFISFTKRLNAA